jgi:hypothetical protein
MYGYFGFSWWWLLPFLLIPDLFMLGYLRNIRYGALLYNIGHTYFTPFSISLLYIFGGTDRFLMIALIWALHIAMDRALGYGLKFESGFKHTHLGEIGK